ncbi:MULTISPECIES: PilZ domain-containing protein [unclassified Maridesulfovibrio]|uniref:PilZ domain-containing protein n=1 Tax=unclassified Maridesulfovibrio TaxID=2794999 RepID=UPI003B3D23B1
MNQSNNQVIIYTDNPETYTNTNLSKFINMEFCSCPNQFCHALLGNNYSGLVLDVRKVMQTPCCDRNRILSVSSGIPTIRTLEKYKHAIFLDDHENFLCDCLNRKYSTAGPACPINVNIETEISLENDPAMAQSIHGTIHHLSEEGCSFHTNADLKNNDFIYLKISSLKNRLPIFCGLYSEKCVHHCSCGFRVKFLDIKEDQKKEIRSTIKHNNIEEISLAS